MKLVRDETNTQGLLKKSYSKKLAAKEHLRISKYTVIQSSNTGEKPPWRDKLIEMTSSCTEGCDKEGRTDNGSL